MQLLLGRVLNPSEDANRNPAPDLINKWQGPPPWGGTEGYRSFFHNFTRAVQVGGAGATVTELYHWTHGDTPATVPEIREVVAEALKDGLIVRQEVGAPDGRQYETYLLNECSPVLNAIMDDRGSRTSNSNELSMPQSLDVGASAVARFAKCSIDSLARVCGFSDGSTLTPEQFIEFFRGGPFTESDLLQSPELYPVGVNYFTPDLRSFVEVLITTAQEAGVVERRELSGGRPVYALADSVLGLYSYSQS